MCSCAVSRCDLDLTLLSVTIEILCGLYRRNLKVLKSCYMVVILVEGCLCTT